MLVQRVGRLARRSRARRAQACEAAGHACRADRSCRRDRKSGRRARAPCSGAERRCARSIGTRTSRDPRRTPFRRSRPAQAERAQRDADPTSDRGLQRDLLPAVGNRKLGRANPERSRRSRPTHGTSTSVGRDRPRPRFLRNASLRSEQDAHQVVGQHEHPAVPARPRNRSERRSLASGPRMSR